MTPVQELEVKIAFLEGQLLDLNDVVRTLGDTVAQLSRRVTELEQQTAPAGDPEAVQVPPHYGKL